MIIPKKWEWRPQRGIQEPSQAAQTLHKAYIKSSSRLGSIPILDEARGEKGCVYSFVRLRPFNPHTSPAMASGDLLVAESQVGEAFATLGFRDVGTPKDLF
jgi:hypothetical protein